MINTCDNWIVIKIKGNDPHYRLLVGTSGGYLDGDSWRLNSGITKFVHDGDYWLVEGSSSSVYRCCKTAYGLRMNNAAIWAKLQKLHSDKVEMMPENTNWRTIDWIIK
jgi:hypothetical protein